jgi:hypothetical protein
MSSTAGMNRTDGFEFDFNATNFCLWVYSETSFTYPPLEIGGKLYSNCSEICTIPALLFSLEPKPTPFDRCLAGIDTRGNQEIQTKDVYANNSQMVEVNRTLATMMETIDVCMNAYCQSPNPTLGGCPYRNISGPLGSFSTNPTGDLRGLFWSSDACTHINLAVLSDFGGPGVCSLYLACCFSLLLTDNRLLYHSACKSHYYCC